MFHHATPNCIRHLLFPFCQEKLRLWDSAPDGLNWVYVLCEGKWRKREAEKIRNSEGRAEDLVCLSTQTSGHFRQGFGC